MRADSLAGDHFVHPVAVEIGQVEAVGLGEAVVDQLLFELELAGRVRAEASPEEQAVVVRVAPDKIVLAVPVHVVNQHRAASVQFPVQMALPLLRERIAACRPLVPSAPEEDIVAAVVVDVAERDAVAVLRADRVADQRGHLSIDDFGLLPLADLDLADLGRKLPNNRGNVFVPLIREPFGLAVAIQVDQVAGLVRGVARVGQQVLRPEVAAEQRLAAGILVPVDLFRHEVHRDDVGAAVAVDVVGPLAVGADIAGVVLDDPQGSREPVSIAVPVAAGGNVELAVAVEVGQVAAFVGVDGQELHFKRNGVIGASRRGGRHRHNQCHRDKPDHFFNLQERVSRENHKVIVA